MRVIVDGDSCRCLGTVLSVCRKKKAELQVFHDPNHQIKLSYGHDHQVDQGINSVDYAIIKECGEGDIIITSDTDLAAMALSKHAICISSNGIEYTEMNIESRLISRYIREREVRKGKAGYKTPYLGYEEKKIPFRMLLIHVLERQKEKNNRKPMT
ncbi:MAG: DUF188 domain-containing protein [Lachnospiraceae bacterium]|nr:DUF188 domain-containing protein [Lachnospiraceae bacterium]